MPTYTNTLASLSDTAQIGLRVPLALVALAGVIVALANLRRLGGAAALLGAVGSALLGIDILLNLWVLWVLRTRDGFELYDRHFNLITISDILLNTIGLALLIVGFAVRHPAERSPAGTGPVVGGYGYQAPGAPGAPATPYQPASWTQAVPPQPAGTPAAWPPPPGQPAAAAPAPPAWPQQPPSSAPPAQPSSAPPSSAPPAPPAWPQQPPAPTGWPQPPQPGQYPGYPAQPSPPPPYPPQ